MNGTLGSGSRRCRTVAMCALTGWALGCLPASAQDITLYGIVDLSLTAVNRGQPENQWVKGVTPSVSIGSRWGIRGQEELEGSLKVVFILEAAFNPDTGTARFYAGDPSTATPSSTGVLNIGFNRISIVGFEGPLGRITFGRAYTPVVFAMIEADIARHGMFGNLISLYQPAGGAEGWGSVSNAVFYTTPVIGGTRARLVYALGSESSGGAGKLPERANEFMGIDVISRQPGLVLSFSYQELKVPLVTADRSAFTGEKEKRRDTLVGGTYTFGDYAVAGGHWRIDFPLQASAVWLGGSVTIGSGTCALQIQRLRQAIATGDRREGVSAGLGYIHHLSKQTAVYATGGRMANNAIGNFALVAGDFFVIPAAPGADLKGVGMGLRMRF